MDHHGCIEWIEKLGSRYLPVEDRRTMKNEWRTSKNGRNLCEIPHGKRYGNVSEAPRLRFSSRKQFFQANSKEREVPKGWTLFFFTSSPIYSKIGEVVAAQLAQASQVASSRSNSLLEEYSGGPKWAWVLFAPPFLLSTPTSAFFGDSFFVKLRKLTNFVMILVFFP